MVPVNIPVQPNRWPCHERRSELLCFQRQTHSGRHMYACTCVEVGAQTNTKTCKCEWKHTGMCFVLMAALSPSSPCQCYTQFPVTFNGCWIELLLGLLSPANSPAENILAANASPQIIVKSFAARYTKASPRAGR